MNFYGSNDIAKTRDGVKVIRKSDDNKNRIFYDANGRPYRCLGYNEKLQDCVFYNFRTGKNVVGCVEGFYSNNPKY